MAGAEGEHAAVRRRQSVRGKSDAAGARAIHVRAQSSFGLGLACEGRVDEAASLLGRHHEVRGVVRHGDARGRKLGFPTANVAVPAEIQLPADGIYAGWFEDAGGDVHSAAISLGRRPTFYEEADVSLLEAHLLDFDGDLYGQLARVRFVASS